MTRKMKALQNKARKAQRKAKKTAANDHKWLDGIMLNIEAEMAQADVEEQREYEQYLELEEEREWGAGFNDRDLDGLVFTNVHSKHF